MDIKSVSNPASQQHRPSECTSSEPMFPEHMAVFVNYIRGSQSEDRPSVEFYACRQNSSVGHMTGLLAMSSSSVVSDTPMSCVVHRSRSDVSLLLAQLTASEAELTVPLASGAILQLWPVHNNAHEQTLRKLIADEPLYALDSLASKGGYDTGAGVPVLMLDANDVKTLPRHRLFADLAGMDDYEFLQRLQKCFNIRVASSSDDACPMAEREFGLYLAGHWYRLRLIDGTWFAADPVSDLDISILQDNMMAPVLGIRSESDARVSQAKGSCTLDSLQAAVDAGQWQAAFVLHPLSLNRLMSLADLHRQAPTDSVAFDTGGLRETLTSVFVSESRSEFRSESLSECESDGATAIAAASAAGAGSL